MNRSDKRPTVGHLSERFTEIVTIGLVIIFFLLSMIQIIRENIGEVRLNLITVLMPIDPSGAARISVWGRGTFGGLSHRGSVGKISFENCKDALF